MLKYLLILISVCVVILLFFLGFGASDYTLENNNMDKQQMPVVKIGNTEILVEIADNAAKHKQGLSGRSSLEDGRGMLFIFDKPDKYAFWMPDMHFSIDIIWIDNGRVVGVEENVSNEFDSRNPKFYFPPKPVRYVLEVNAGLTRNHNIKIGDIATLPSIDQAGIFHRALY